MVEDTTSQQRRPSIPEKTAAEVTGHWGDLANVEIVKAASLILNSHLYMLHFETHCPLKWDL